MSARAGDVRHLTPTAWSCGWTGSRVRSTCCSISRAAQKVDLAQISILSLVEQYLAVIEGARRVRLELAADWLVMAAWLTWLKSRLLLPAGAERRGGRSRRPTCWRPGCAICRRCGRRRPGWPRRPQLGHDVFARGAPEDHTEIDRSAWRWTCRRCCAPISPRAPAPCAPALPAAAADVVEREGGAAAARATWSAACPTGRAWSTSCRTHWRPAGAPRGAGQHAAGRAGDGARRRGAAAAGAAISARSWCGARPARVEEGA